MKKILRTAVILCAAVAAGVSAGSSGNIAKANGEIMRTFFLRMDGKGLTLIHHFAIGRIMNQIW